MALKMFIRSVASLSWIDPKTGLPLVDLGDPGRTILRAEVFNKVKYRFANFLEGSITVNDMGQPVAWGFTGASGMYQALSYMNIPSVAYSPIRNIAVLNGTVTFTQLVGCRTHSPEVIAEAVGSDTGRQLAELATVASGLPVAGAVRAAGRLGAKIGGATGEIVGKALVAFPPIWTQLQLTINPDGTFFGELLLHSLFPSVTFYSQPGIRRGEAGPLDNAVIGYNRVSTYDGDKRALDLWEKEGWGALGGHCGCGPVSGSPFGVEKFDER